MFFLIARNRNRKSEVAAEKAAAFFSKFFIKNKNGVAGARGNDSLRTENDSLLKALRPYFAFVIL
jgi:hypothetical protein